MQLKKAVVLLSGGLDSSTLLAYAKSKGFDCHSLSFNYGQRHGIELKAASELAKFYNVSEHKLINIDLNTFGGSALTADIRVPKHRSDDEMEKEIPVTYVPARNTIFLSYALAYAEVLQAYDIFIGVNAVDYSGYPDCRPAFIKSFEIMANLATKNGVEGAGLLSIHTPLIDLKKSEIIQLGLDLGVDYSKTVTCYDPLENGKPCAVCDSCKLRQRGFKELGIQDPALLK